MKKIFNQNQQGSKNGPVRLVRVIPNPATKPFDPKNPQHMDSTAPATLKQKSLILTLYQRRKLPLPDISDLTKQQASTMIGNMIESRE